jgi:AraC-like DNA-binding protein
MDNLVTEMDHPLASFPIASTRDTDEAQSILSRELTDLRFKRVRNHRSFHLEMNGIHLGRTMIGYNQFSTDTLVDTGEIEGAMVLVIGVGPPTISYIDKERVVCTERGAILSPDRRVIHQRPANGGVFVIRTGFDAIEERFREVMDRRPGKSIVFDRSVDLEKGVGAQTRRLLGSLVDTIQQDSTILENPLLRASFDDMLLNALLALPNNYSDELMGGRRLSVAPRLVRQAEEFLEAHATEPVTISDLVEQCGCSRRAIFTAFNKYRGYTPMQFLADARLKSAREALQSPSPGDTVSSITYACGFSHPGRFSAAYRRRFGESPSETLRKAGSTIGT